MKKVLILFVLTAGAWGSAITVSGSGTFSNSRDANSWEVSFFGEGVSGMFMGDLGSPLYGSIGGWNTHSPLGALIDGQYFSPGYASMWIGNESGSITGYGKDMMPLITQPLIGSITIVREICTSGPNPYLRSCDGSFTVHAPEPSSWGLVLIVLLAIAAIRIRRGARPAVLMLFCALGLNAQGKPPSKKTIGGAEKAPPKATVYTPPPPRTPLTPEETIELIEMERKLDEKRNDLTKYQAGMQARFEQLKDKHNAQGCDMNISTYSWQACKDPGPPKAETKSKK